MASETAALDPGTHTSGELIAGRYVLVRSLGEGGMGVVWVARSTALDVEVALKMLRPELAGTDAVERMAREARTAAQLGHPAIVRALDFGTSEGGEPFLAMELLQGEELSVLLARERRLPVERVAALLLPIIDGLATAHDKGIVHRDIKPENIFIACDDHGRIQPKVLDFGIAKLDRDYPLSRLTQTGAILGSPQYFSPEQAAGLDDIDFRSDIWSVGVLLYELSTGAPPFAAKNYNALIRSILRDAPSPVADYGAGDARLWAIIERCLRKEPSERWDSMWELGTVLARWLFDRGVSVDAASRSLHDNWLAGDETALAVPLDVDDANLTEAAAALPETQVPPPPVETTRRVARDPSKRRLLPKVAVIAVISGFVLAALYRHGSANVGASSRFSHPPEAIEQQSPRPAVDVKVASPAPAFALDATQAAGARTANPSTTIARSAAPSTVPPPSSTSSAAVRAASRGKAPPRRAAVDTEFGF